MIDRKLTQGFYNGFRQLRGCEIKEFITEAKEALGLTSDSAFFSYRRGRSDPRISQIIAIEEVFKKYGITKNIWGK